MAFGVPPIATIILVPLQIFGDAVFQDLQGPLVYRRAPSLPWSPAFELQ